MKKLTAQFLAVIMVVSIFTATPVLANSPNVTAPIAVVMCFDTGDILYDRNMEQRWIPASMTKIMTAYITYLEIEAGNLTLDTNVRISQNVATFSQNRRIEGSFVPFNAGANVSVETLLRLLMLPSSNGAAVALAEHISGTEEAFVARMNQVAEDIGMYASFNNSHGAFAHHSNAYSIARLIRTFIIEFPDILRITAMPRVTFGGTTYNNTNRLLGTHYYRGADGFKTGTIRASGWGHSTTAYRDGRRVIAVLMNTPNNEARQSQSRVLLDFGFAELARREAELVSRVRVFHTGTALPLETPAVLRGETLMLPLSDILRPLGYRLSWDSESQTAIVRDNNGMASSAVVGSRSANANGRAIRLAVPAEMVGSRVYVPIDFIEQVTGTTASWDRTTGVVNFR